MGKNVLSHNPRSKGYTDAINRAVIFTLNGRRERRLEPKPAKRVTFTLNGFVCGKQLEFRDTTLVSQIGVDAHVSLASQIVVGKNVLSHNPRKVISKGHTDAINRCCACGDPYCNIITKFLGTVLVKTKCSYAYPSKLQSKKKQFRSKQIRLKLTEFRTNTNKRFRHQIPSEPHKNDRFNEIHYPISFLNKFKTNRRIPESIDIDMAKQVNMFRHDLVRADSHTRKQCVVVVPTLDAHQSIQVNIL